MITKHHYVKTREAAATLAVKAGLDLECGNQVYGEGLLKAYRQYMVSEADRLRCLPDSPGAYDVGIV